MFRSGYAVHLRRDTIEERVGIISDLIQIEVGAARQEGELRIPAKPVER